MSSQAPSEVRVIGYIDGFNLYFGLRERGWRKFMWLNLRALMEHLLKANQRLVCTKYFTSRIKGSKGKEQRQSTYIEALETLDNFQIFYGHYQLNARDCRKCNFRDYVPFEKKTDVNIAVEMLSDAFENKFDTALLVSADSDLVPAVRAIKSLFPKKRVVVAFPPKRFSAEMAAAAHAYFTILPAVLKKSLFPKQVTSRSGFLLTSPLKWT